MASIARTATRRLSARRLILLENHQQHAAGFRSSAAALAAQNFTMPALSPTMTQGNIAKWKVKEGDSFSAGDVLLEIETDKASMDVEAQDDGILVKIFQNDGSQNIQVGSRIGVLAEPGDDIASLEIPADEPLPKTSSPAPKENEQRQPTSENTTKTATKPAQPPKTSGKKNPPQKYPLYPSVEHLVKEHKLDEAAISQITPTGPLGRLLKGDVLAYLGSIDANRPAQIKARFDHNAHLDLTNIKVAPPKEKKSDAAAAAADKKAPAAPVREELSISLPVSLAAVVEVQKKLEASLGTFIPLSTFIARAVDVANEDLPLAANYKPTADELFNEVLGLDTVGPSGSRGHYLPQIAALNPSFTNGVAPKPRPTKPLDVIDFLAGGPARKSAPAPPRPQAGVSVTGPNSFTLQVPRAEERRAKAFLQRVKVVLEDEPGQLVL